MYTSVAMSSYIIPFFAPPTVYEGPQVVPIASQASINMVLDSEGYILISRKLKIWIGMQK